MLPLRDINPTEKFPFVTLSIVILCTLVFLKEISLPPDQLNQMIATFGFVPRNFFFSDLPVTERFVPVLSSMFLHGGFMHLFGNMLYLWIFGNNVEDRLGHMNFLIFYILSGIAAAFTQGIFDINSEIPMIGASGAIAGVLAAYFILFPGARIRTLVFFFPWITVTEIPAFILIGIWFILQFFNSLASITATGPGVAYLAHVGGFVAGFILIFIFPKRRQRRYIPPDYFF